MFIFKSTTREITAMKSKELEIFQAFFSNYLCVKSFNGPSSIRATNPDFNSHKKIKSMGIFQVFKLDVLDMWVTYIFKSAIFIEIYHEDIIF